jgi:predicted permease
MRRLRAWSLRLAGLFGQERRERELAEEMESHLALHIEDNLRAGMSTEVARRRALIQLGCVEATKELYRERRGLPFVETVRQDLRFAARMTRKNPGFTAIAALTLALGIGANTAIFNIVNAVILRPLPYQDSSRIVAFTTKTAMFPGFSLGLSWPAFEEIREHAGSLEQTAACWEMDRRLTRSGPPAVLNVVGITDGFFEEFGARAEQGRLLSPQDQKPGQDRVAVISSALWRARFAGDPAVIGRSLTLDNQTYTIAGVAGNAFAFPERTDVWVPLVLTAETQENPAFFRLGVFGKLKKGASMRTLQVEVATITQGLAQQLTKEKPDLRGGYQILTETLHGNRVAEARTSYLVLLAAATLVLLIACANLASLLLARGWGRHREMAVRVALGASSWRLMRQVLVESCMLALLGGIAGIALGAGGVQIFRAIAPAETPRLSEVSVDWTLLWFALASALLSGIVLGLAPAWRAARMTPNKLMKEEAGANIAGKWRIGSALVVVEVALAFILIIGSTLMAQTLLHLLHESPGFRSDHLLTFDMPQPAKWSEKDTDSRLRTQVAQLREILADIRSLPGVEGVAASDHSVLAGTTYSNAGLRLEGALPENVTVGEGVSARLISPGYFRMLGTALLRGREFDEHDVPSAQKVIIVNEKMAQKYWGTLEVVGKHVSVEKDERGDPQWNEIVGVVANARDVIIQNEPEPEFFLALFQGSADSYYVIARTDTNPGALTDIISRQIWAKNPDQPVTHMTSMTATIAESAGDQRMQTALLGIFAALGLALALLGVYGVVSYSVARRTQEIGVRMALGAKRIDVLSMVLRQGLTLVLLGALIGVAGALAGVRVISSELYGVAPTDPWTFCGSALLLVMVGCLACWIPARRAMRVEPMVALRYE